MMADGSMNRQANDTICGWGYCRCFLFLALLQEICTSCYYRHRRSPDHCRGCCPGDGMKRLLHTDVGHRISTCFLRSRIAAEVRCGTLREIAPRTTRFAA